MGEDKAQSGGGGFLQTPSHAARSCVPKRPPLGCKLHLRERVPLLLPGPRPRSNRVSATRAYADLLEGNAKKETFGTAPAASPPHLSLPHAPFLGSDLAAAGPSLPSESAASPPPYCPPLKTKKAAGNPGLARVQVISCFLMGSNSY